MGTDEERTDPETRVMEREAQGSSLIGYAIIKYTALTFMVIAVLYFIANYILPML